MTHCQTKALSQSQRFNRALSQRVLFGDDQESETFMATIASPSKSFRKDDTRPIYSYPDEGVPVLLPTALEVDSESKED